MARWETDGLRRSAGIHLLPDCPTKKRSCFPIPDQLRPHLSAPVPRRRLRNVGLIWTLAVRRRLHLVPNIFLANLAFSDLLLAFVAGISHRNLSIPISTHRSNSSRFGSRIFSLIDKMNVDSSIVASQFSSHRYRLYEPLDVL